MANRKTLGMVVLVVGIIILALFVLADPIGIGRSSGFGRDQIVGSVVGAIVTIAGLVLVFRE
jgi:low affinity Fe/Cu permease